MQELRKRKHSDSLTSEEVAMDFRESCKAFFHLLEHPHIKAFLEKDQCRILADKYILATVFAFFRRANFKQAEYNQRNFYLALHLAHELYEEIEDFKEEIVQSYLGRHKEKKGYYKKFMQDRFALLQRIEFRCSVSKQMCDYLIKRVPHWAWERTRNDDHSGVFYKHIHCKNCL